MRLINEGTSEMANNLRKVVASSSQPGMTPPRQPDYPDELSLEQLEKIRLFVDPNGERAANRKVLHSAGW